MRAKILALTNKAKDRPVATEQYRVKRGGRGDQPIDFCCRLQPTAAALVWVLANDAVGDVDVQAEGCAGAVFLGFRHHCFHRY